MVEIDFAKIEKKWQDKWENAGIFEADDKSKQKKFYVLEMFPYPSSAGLHMGHAFNYTIGDIIARLKIMQGFNVLHPMGYDSLGLPAENAAIKAKTHPEKYTNNSIKNFMKQQKKLGLSYDWSRMINTADPNYYKWDQWIFLKMFEKGLVYEKEANVNWCPKCETILANEQVHEGKCWRHDDTEVEIKPMKQWFLKITDYADRLLEGHKKLNWPEKTIAMQKNWIGKSHGTEIDFEVFPQRDASIISNVIIVHGTADDKKDKPTNHWMPWLKKSLVEKNIKVEIPLMPEPWKINYSKWKKEFEKLNVDENSVLIGHSCGCAFLVRWLGETKQKIKKLILVAPWKFAESDSEKEFYDFKINDKIKNQVDETIIFTSDNEETDGKKSAKIFHESLGGKLIELKNHGHFTFGDMGTEEFSELLNELSSNKKWPIFTTRPDTIYGVTFMVVSAQHPKLYELVSDKERKYVEKFLKKLKSVSEKDIGDLEKEGVFTGSYAKNPVTGNWVPIYAGNFVVADYGSGMVMAVPAHDQRDFEFAKKYNLSMKLVIGDEDYNFDKGAYTESGKLINSDKFSGLNNEEAKKKITDFLIEKKIARRVVNYKLRDWSVARQRYWGTPIPLIHCAKCGIVPVPERDLPVKLPKEVKFGSGNPLLTNKEWLSVKCPKCKGNARREANTMDTFVNSSWYFFRYCDPQNKKEIFSKAKSKYWMPVDLYIGGAEHACMHLIYCRFYTMFLHDLGLIDFDEPAPRLFHQGMINDANGEKMSKSKGNVIEPLETMEKYGVDTTRFFMMSEASPDKGFNWSDKGIQGSLRFVNKFLETFDNLKFGKDSEDFEIKLNNSIKNVTEQIEVIDYRKSTIELRELIDAVSIQKEISKQSAEKVLKLISPFCPHISEEVWEKIGNNKNEKNFISTEKWPEFDKTKLVKKIKEVDLNEKIILYLKEPLEKLREKGQTFSKIFIYVMPFEIGRVDSKKIGKILNKEIQIYSVTDSKKFDPEEKAKKSRPGMPGFYVE